jgi:hypothetical protein
MNHRLKTIGDEIEKGLQTIHKPHPEQGVYKLNSIHQVFTRARGMLSEARLSVVVDADTETIEELREDFEATAARGIKVLLHGRKPMEVEGCEVISSVTEGWSGQLLVVLVDGAQYLIALMSRDLRSLVQAIWSRNQFIAACIYRGYMVKALFYRISMMIGEDKHSLEEIRAELNRLWDTWGYGDPGKEALQKLLRKPHIK